MFQIRNLKNPLGSRNKLRFELCIVFIMKPEKLCIAETLVLLYTSFLSLTSHLESIYH
jgi:hypothetical protein